jgi:hypothetical protein
MTRDMGIFSMSIILCSILIASFAVAVQFDSQPRQAGQFPDIQAYKIEVLPETPQPGQTVEIKGYYSVTGCASKPFFGNIKVGQITIVEQELKNMCPDCTKPGCNQWWDYFLITRWKAVPGKHTISFTADSKNNIWEGPFNEDNNVIRSKTIIVPISTDFKSDTTQRPQPLQKPDLSCYFEKISEHSLYMWFVNNSMVQANNFSFRYERIKDGVKVFENTLSGYSLGGNEKLPYHITRTCEPGIKYIGIVDSGGALAETDETNNTCVHYCNDPMIPSDKKLPVDKNINPVIPRTR